MLHNGVQSMYRGTVSRQDVAKVLTAWQREELTTQQVWDWAARRFPDDEDVGCAYDDKEGDDSVLREVLRELDCLDMQLVVPEDVPIYLEFLDTPSGEFARGYARWRAALDRIDSAERQRQCRQDPLYRPFCK